VKFITAFLITIFSFSAFAAELSLRGGFMTPDKMEAVTYGVGITERFEISETHNLRLEAKYDAIDFNSAASFMPDRLERAELGARLLGTEYFIDTKFGVAGDEAFSTSDSIYVQFVGTKKVYESGRHGFHLGIAASNKKFLDEYTILPALAYSYRTETLNMMIGSVNLITWKPNEKYSLEAGITILGQGQVKGTYHWSSDFKTSLIYRNVYDVFYLSDDYPDDTYLKIRTASVMLEAEKNLYGYATLVLSAGMITSAKYYTYDKDDADDRINSQSVNTGAIGSAELRIKF
jgi:hypothetical protein